MSRFDGSVLVNQRVVTAVTSHFKRRRLGERRDQPMTVDDLVDLLYLIDLYVVCPTICIDGSLPARDLDAVREELAFLGAYGIQDHLFTFKSPGDVRDKQTLCSLSAAQALKTFDDVALDVRIDQRLPGKDASAISSAIDNVMQRLDSSRGTSREFEIANALSGELSEQSFRGNKAVAGFASLGFHALDKIRRFIRSTPQELACSALINRFRFFYLRQLGFRQGAIYSPGDRWESLSNQQQLHFLTYIKQRLAATGQFQAGDTPAETMLQPEHGEQASFPPIALYALLTMDETGSRPLLERVAELRGEFGAMRGYFARQTSAALKELIDPDILTSSDPRLEAELIEAVNDFFARQYSRLEYQRRYGADAPGAASKVVKYTVPVIVSLSLGGIGLAVAGWMGAAVGAGVWSVAGDFLKEVSKDVVADRFDVSGTAAIDQYRRLHFQLLQDQNVAARLRRIVKREFDCDIDLAISTSP